MEIFSYANAIVIVSRKASVFYDQFVELKKKLIKIGLLLKRKSSIKPLISISSKIKFQYLGFEFIILSKKYLRHSSLTTNIKNFYCLSKNFKRFVIFLRPQIKKIKETKKRLKIIIRKILHQSWSCIYKTFQLVNFILLGWGFHYYFNQGCVYGKKLDSFVFTYIKKILVKKFRYNGLLRPRWVAYRFLGLDKINPNGHKWQLCAAQYVKNSSKISRYIYIWLCSDFFYKSSIVSFFLSSDLRDKNYYSYRNAMDKNLNRLIINRLKFDLKVKIYKNQNGLCAICHNLICEYELLTCSFKSHTFSLLLHNTWAQNNLHATFVVSKIILHNKCYLAFCKSIFLLRKRVF